MLFLSNSRWEISGWTYGGTPVSTSTSLIPLTSWTIIGTPNPYSTVYSASGNCPVVSPLVISTQVVNASCAQGTCNGSIFVNTTGGVPPYSYSIDGVNFQASNIFTNLCPTTFGLVVLDSVGNRISQSVTVGYNNTFTTYVISLNVQNVIILDTNNKKIEWNVTVSPPLPVGPTIEFELNVSSLQQKQGPFNGSPNTTMSITRVNQVEYNTIPQTLTNTTGVQTLPNVCSPGYLTMEQTTLTDRKTFSIGSTDTLTGKIGRAHV